MPPHLISDAHEWIKEIYTVLHFNSLNSINASASIQQNQNTALVNEVRYCRLLPRLTMKQLIHTYKNRRSVNKLRPQIAGGGYD